MSNISYPNHPDFDYTMSIERLRAEKLADYDRQPWIAFIVSEAWVDSAWLKNQIAQIAFKYPKAQLLMPERAVGGSQVAKEAAAAVGLNVIEIRSESTWGDGRQAVQAAWFCKLADIIVVAWAGGTDLPDKVIRKGLLVHRPDDRFLPGMHLYEMVLKKERESNGTNDKGKTKWKVVKTPTGKVIHKVRDKTAMVKA